MEYLIIILLIIIILLSLYLFLIRKELKRITDCLKKVKNDDSNQLINKELSSKDIGNLLKEINDLLKNNREEKMEYESKNKALRKMITNISHDLRTPLTSALGYVDLIEKSNLSIKEKEEFLNIISERLKRLEELLNSFFEFSKIISNNKVIDLKSINIIPILEECIGHYYDDFAKLNRKIILKNNLKKCFLNSNETLLKRIFDNLIINSFKHSGGDLIIEVLADENLTISFSNKLLSNDLEIDHIFDEFYTTDISRTKGNTGLGLAIAKEFTKNLNGTISATKEKDNLKIILSFKK